MLTELKKYSDDIEVSYEAVEDMSRIVGVSVATMVQLTVHRTQAEDGASQIGAAAGKVYEGINAAGKIVIIGTY